MNKIQLLPKEELIKTGPVDHADWNYKSILKYIQLKRFQLCLKLLENQKVDNLLEIGYGSGIFIPTLSKFASSVSGIDIHTKNKEVEKVLFNHKIKANLLSANATKIPFKNNYFDVVISISTIEFIDDLESVCQEVIRVLKKDGIFIVITPGFSKVLDFGLKILTNKNAKSDFDDRRKYILPVLKKYFTVKRKIPFPKYSIPSLQLYNALYLEKPHEY